MKNLRVQDPNELLKVLDIKGIPDVTKMAKKCNIKIWVGDITDQVIDTKLERTLGNVKGAIMIGNSESADKRIIMINNQCTPTSQRFIAAYLFSSYQLNGEDEKEFIDIVHDESIYDEKVYNYTLDLLMPDHLFDAGMEIEDKQFLAKIYNVSEFLIDKKLEKKIKENK